MHQISLSIVITCYNELYELMTLLYSFASNKNTDFNFYIQFIVMHDTENKKLKERINEVFKEIKKIKPTFSFEYYESKKHHGLWGHPLREEALQYVKGTWLLWTNCDNYYVPNFIQTISKHTGNIDLAAIYFDFVTEKRKTGEYYNFDTQFGINKCDMGSFIVRSKIAKEIGFKDRTYAADGIFIEKLKLSAKTKGLNIKKIYSTMLVHN